MSDIIAVIWDFDKTLTPGYMQDPIFKYYGVNGAKFWKENERRIDLLKEKGLDVNKDTYYLNSLIKEAKPEGKFKGLNNNRLKKLGKKIEFFPGVLEIFKKITKMTNDKRYRPYGIRFENYVVSTGLKRMIEGSKIAPYVTKIWGAELVDEKLENGKSRITEIAYSLDNSTKTRAIFEINKGVGIEKGSTIDVNTKIPMAERRVQFYNMIYIADGPSDVPAFSLLNKNNGSTMAVYADNDPVSFCKADDLRTNGRVQMVAPADYREGSPAYLWIMRQLEVKAKKIIDAKIAPFMKGAGTPQHIID